MSPRSRIDLVANSTENSGEADNEDDDEYSTLSIDDEEQAILDAILAAGDPQSSPIALVDIEDYEPQHGVRVPEVHLRQSTRRVVQQEILRDLEPTSAIVRNDEAPQRRQENRQERQPDNRQEQRPENRQEQRPENRQEQRPPLQNDTRSPLQRFRRPPHKALSVTDLVSPAWCELQFFYTLSKHGRKRPTAAMKQGTKVHQQLEDEVHVTVPVEVMTLEDSWALRIWNVIQGLATLRETGRTRELEVWGTVGGEIVNGVIDEVGYRCPDPKLKAALEAAQGNGKKRTKKENIGVRDEELPEYHQTSITEFLTTASQEEDSREMTAALRSNEKAEVVVEEEEKQIYITDVKTRTSARLPTGSSTKPTILQLHLYHHMLENLAQGNFSLIQLTQRYNLDPDATFSDSFIAQIANLNQDLYVGEAENDSGHDLAPPPSTQDSIDLILAHNNLSSLWDFMISQFHLTFLLPSSITSSGPPTSTPQSVSDLPAPPSQPTRISPILTAEYLAADYNSNNRRQARRSKQFLGRKSFVFDPLYLKAYLEDSLQWWRGEREAHGVQLQEAWKCRSCDFRDDCEWLHERDREAWEKVMGRKALRNAVGPDGSGAGGGKSVV
ncbi:hypothetical protein DV737_g3186, partial [Chaetothyriales sp. CBS 132003]